MLLSEEIPLMRNIFFIFIGVITIIYIFLKIRKKIFTERESFFWLIGGIIILTLSFFPEGLNKFSLFIGIKYPPALLFLISIVLLYLLLFKQEEQISIQNEKLKKLAQENALIEEKLRRVIKKLGD